MLIISPCKGDELILTEKGHGIFTHTTFQLNSGMNALVVMVGYLHMTKPLWSVAGLATGTGNKTDRFAINSPH